ncbi:DegT/DnrJ/EryC1/StrS family aminotransferase [Croceimicrobium hydrocarbonivorans]|uniref:DegT/DnrJ/EryC1/StrS family aminotransferase n=1 Tax=Croceimicrobium hydrocarbonivorans TaxID=2761580 RepID=A0A7H0VBK1_9FLAO|nr:DegT/DnrJ/EryC1/StrS family aminotransferase [Croceimicrobium hydrocarbonivorans]QNR23099.1 DegT/DnrJ/EryC1/StrS family aminotransferase [Croceimicrobium hydrocarbonivorans]
MKKIQMVDLVSQYQKIQDQVDKAILDVVRSSAYINGPEVKAFQSDLESYLGVKHVIPCANGTDALQIAMMALGLKPGDEVITATFTYVATAEVIALLGLTPVLVDVDEDTFGLNTDQVREAIGPKTKAIVPVHLFGQCADLETIMQIAKEHNLYVVEDTAQAIGSSYYFENGSSAKAGTIGDIGTTSFFPSKNLGCFGDGGAIFTNDDDLASKIRIIANHGQTVRYYHDMIGVNSRLDSIQAAILRCKLPHLDEYIKARQAVADYYDQAFANTPELKTPVRDSKSEHVFHQYTLQLAEGIDRNKLVEYLQTKDIPAMIYYPVALHMQKAYQDERYQKDDFPITNRLVSRVFSLPMHTELEKDQLEHITSEVLNFIKNH